MFSPKRQPLLSIKNTDTKKSVSKLQFEKLSEAKNSVYKKINLAITQLGLFKIILYILQVHYK